MVGIWHPVVWGGMDKQLYVYQQRINFICFRYACAAVANNQD